MMDAPAPQPETSDDSPGAVRGLIAALIDALHTRIELAGVELEIHVRALLRSLLWAVGAVACAMLALAFGVTALIAAFWDTHRMLALLGGSLLFIVMAAVFSYLAARTLRGRPDVLAGSLGQLAQDERRVRGGS
jgi:uncharacterized membrane protein YqjE